MNNIKQLNKAYTKRFMQLNKNMVTDLDAGLIIFVEHLKYLRDLSIVNKRDDDAVVTLAAAIEEFEAFNTTKQEFHWNNFCEFVKLNMKEWLVSNDSV
jgi:hypothetical protein